MSRATQAREIDGVTYVVTQLGGEDGLVTLARLTKILGPAMASADDGMIGAAFAAVSKLDPLELLPIVRVFAPSTKIHKPIQSSGAKAIEVSLDVDSHFAGKVGSLLSWLAFCVEVNYADFFGEIAGKLGAATEAMRAAVSPSPSTSASAGPSSESPAAAGSATP